MRVAQFCITIYRDQLIISSTQRRLSKNKTKKKIFIGIENRKQKILKFNFQKIILINMDVIFKVSFIFGAKTLKFCEEFFFSNAEKVVVQLSYTFYGLMLYKDLVK